MPTSKVSKYLYNKNRNSIILYCKENSNKEIYYEPIVTLTETKDTKRYSNFSISENRFPLHDILMRINQNVISKCESSLINKAYTFSQNIDIHSIVLHHKSILDKIGIVIKKQIINHDNKVIGIDIIYKDHNLFVPLQPSSIHRFYDYELVRWCLEFI